MRNVSATNGDEGREMFVVLYSIFSISFLRIVSFHVTFLSLYAF